MEYETGKYKFVDTGSHVVVFRDGEKWGVPQGHNFLRVLLQDIQQLQEQKDFWLRNYETLERKLRIKESGNKASDRNDEALKKMED